MVLVTIVRIVMVGASPFIVVTNVLILSAWFRFKRLRTPSNSLIVSLAAADFGFGLCLPMAVIYQLFSSSTTNSSAADSFSREFDHQAQLQQQLPPLPLQDFEDRNNNLDELTTHSSSSNNNYNNNVNSNEGTVTTITVLPPMYVSSPAHSPPTQMTMTLLTMASPSSVEFPNFNFNIRPFSILVVFSVASLLSIGAIALDRFTSVAQPLRYNHFVTTTHVQRFIGGCWLYAFCMGILAHVISDFDPSWNEARHLGGNSNSSGVGVGVGVGATSSPPVLLLTWLFFLVYLPCLLLTFISYGYIYLVARSHARAIYSVEVSLHHHDHDHDTTLVTTLEDGGSRSRPRTTSGGGGRVIKVEDVSSHTTSSFHHRYGLTLALILSIFIISWLPLLSSALLDFFCSSHILETESLRALVSLPILCNSLVNPWLYGFRSSEMRIAVFRMWDGVMGRIVGGRETRFSTLDTKGAELTSCASNVRLMNVSPTQTTVQCCSSHHDRNHLTILLCDQTQL